MIKCSPIEAAAEPAAEAAGKAPAKINTDTNKKEISKKSNRLERTSGHGWRRPDDERHKLNLLSSEDVITPETVEEALESPQAIKWQKTRAQEFGALKVNGTWEPAELPSNHKAIGCKWVFALKRDKNGTIERYKARLVAKGCRQKHGVNYDKTASSAICDMRQ
ncbi:uncharacterized mitochondrial protein AtMg00820-like [Drosophila grimshawi]|uniref:uncharacterized mitochondrial protein AtMg00820-like n=1 Tax=Drosophila grimshawi TaxID=7222 RepID=UPI001C935498|nr:uncharacterized mitochondrial protein AtMg00820-like [Drosophila grimshawi]